MGAVSALPDAGYVYVVNGARRYLEEALVSARSLRRHDPEAHITLVADAGLAADPEARSAFDHIVTAPREPAESTAAWKAGLLFKAQHMFTGSPYARSFYVDADTYFAGSCRALFEHLEHYDLSIAHAANDRQPAVVGGRELGGMTPYNTGIILFRRNEAVRELFAHWGERYARQIARDPHDQPAFVEALAESRCRVYVLTNNWNARIRIPEKYCGRVLVLHGRHGDLAHIERRINVTTHPRLWLPQAETCVHERMGPRSALRVAWYLACLALRGLVAALRPARPRTGA